MREKRTGKEHEGRREQGRNMKGEENMEGT